jgi:hypothetical protein
VQEVIKLLSRVVRARCERSRPTDTRVDEITPVLYQERQQFLSANPRLRI